jgi:hypothetical protein
MPDPIDLLARAVYGMGQVDWILRLRPGTARRWIDGYARAGKAYPPIVRLESSGDDLVTWGEFIEARLLSEFRDSGVPIFRMRPAVERLRERFNRLYPLAHARPWLEEGGRELVMRVQEEVHLEKPLLLVVVRNDQLVLSSPADQFVQSVDFGDAKIVQRMNLFQTSRKYGSIHCASSASRSSGAFRPPSSLSKFVPEMKPQRLRSYMSSATSRSGRQSVTSCSEGEKSNRRPKWQQVPGASASSWMRRRWDWASASLPPGAIWSTRVTPASLQCRLAHLIRTGCRLWRYSALL